MEKSLKNQVAVITGGAAGIGKAACELFASQGAQLAIWDLNAQQGAALANSLSEKGHKARFYPVNTSSMEAVQQAALQVIEDFGQIDILVNNAGITRDASLKKMTPEQWQQVIDVNLTGVFNCTKTISAHMVERGYGRIINTSSVVALYGNFGQTNYVATKAGVIGLTKVWARELGPKGITCNAVAPGFIATDMVKTIPDNVIQDIEKKIPLGRMGKPEDIAQAYAFLASQAASYINGHVLSVDGGMTI
jgi:3-oxoacyl-[acyl-carrier protein] reductase